MELAVVLLSVVATLLVVGLGVALRRSARLRSELARSRSELEEVRATLATREVEVDAARAEVASRDARLGEQEARRVELEARLAEREALLAERDAELAVRDDELSRLDAALASLQAELAAEREAQREAGAAETLPAVPSDDAVGWLWGLELSRSDRTWRDAVAPMPGEPSPLATAEDPLEAAVRIEAAAVREQAGTVVHVDWDVPPGLQPGAMLAVLRAVQEALAAAAKQTEAVAVRGERDGDDVVLRISGLDADDQPHPLDLPPGLGATVRIPTHPSSSPTAH